MGKTKTAIISEKPSNDGDSSLDKLKAKRARQEAQKKEEAKLATTEKTESLPNESKTKEKKPRGKKVDKKGREQVAKVGLKGGERLKTIEMDIPKPNEEEKTENARKPRVRGKKYVESVTKVDANRSYETTEAVKLLKETSFTNFDATAELHLVVKKVGLSVQIELPHSTGKQKKVEIASSTTIEKLKKGKVDFDILLSTAEMMPKLVAFARILGPKGMMPNPKNGTLIKDAKEADKFKGSSVTIKTEKKQPVIHTLVGKVSQKDKEIIENINAVVVKITKQQITKAVLTSTMGPGIKLSI